MSKPLAVVTGGGSGIGRAICRELHGRGYAIFAQSLGEAELGEVRAELGSDVHTLALDLSRPGAASTLVEALHTAGLEPDILVNCAGLGVWGEHVELDAGRVETMLGVNVSALTSLCGLLGREMKARGRGRILNVASTASFQPLPHLAGYAATKHYVVAFSRALAQELGPHGVHVSVVCPGTTRTPFLAAAGIDAKVDKVAERFAMLPQEVAIRSVAGMLAGRRHIVPGGINRVHYWVSRFMPACVMSSLWRRVWSRH